MRALDRFQEYADDPQGFQGVQVLLPDDPDQATLVTLWGSGAAREASQYGIFRSIMDGLQELLEAPPEIKDQELRDVGPGIIQTSVWTT